MAGNPIKHVEIIEPGNPLDETIKGLETTIKLVNKLTKDLKKSAKEWQQFTQKQNASTKEGQTNLKKAAEATQKLTVKEKEALKLKQQLIRQQEKVNVLKTEEGKKTLAQVEALKRQEREIKKIAKAQDRGAKSTNTWRKAMGSFATKFNTIGNIAGVMFQRITAGAKKFIKEATQMALEMEGVENAFNKLNDPNLLGNLQKATRGTVNNLELMKTAVLAKNFKIPLEQLAVFLKFAGDRALDTGEDFEFLVQSIVKGLGRKSVLILDNLGLSVTEINEEVKKTGDFMQGAANIIAREMEASGVVLDTNLVLLKQMNTEFANMKMESGKVLIQGALGAKNLVKSQLSFRGLSSVIVDREVRKALKELGESGAIVNSELGEMEQRIAAVKQKREDEIVTLAKLGEEMSFLKEVRERTNVLELSAINQEIAALDKKIKKYTELGTVISGIPPIAEVIEIDDEDDFDITTMFGKDFQKAAIDNTKFLGGLQKRFRETFAKEDKAAKQEEQEGEDAKKDNIIAGLNAVQQASNSFFSFKEKQLDNQFKAELEAADGNAEKIAEIQERQAKEEQDLAVKKALINGALGAAKTIANLGFPAAIPALIAQAAVTAFQIAAITSVQFEEGGSGMLDKEGHILQGPSHGAGGINPRIEAEGGEYFGIINKHMTRKYQSELPGIFESINNGRFHDVFSRSNIELNKASIFNDPWGKNIYDLLKNQPSAYNDSEGNQVLLFPDGRKRVIKQHGI